MITRNLKRWIALPLVLGAILYACQSENSPDIDTKQPVAPLTVATARSLYEQYVGTIAYLKSDGGNSDFNLIPDWNAGQLFSDSNWYVVESPLELGDDMKMTFMTQDVGEYVQQHENIQVEQILRLVVMRNRETGLDYSFIMLVMPELDYMVRKGATIHENKYLTRESDLDGYVYFLAPDGSFVNAWKYKEGKIVGRTLLSTDKATKGFIQVETCYWAKYTYGGIESWNYKCEYDWLYVEENKDAPPAIDGGGPIDPGYDPMSGPGGGGIPTLDKDPEKRTDCPSSAAQNASNAENAMKGNADITGKMSTLRNYASSKSNEYGMLINVVNGSLQGGSIQVGNYNSLNMPIDSNTAYTIHSHHYGGQKVPSASDIYGTIVGVGKSSHYKGSTILAYDGSECLIYVEDYQKAKKNI
jgi:hypothetical protein